jgi:peptidoglycan/LPS O-acetylase OafA/YrhL
MLMQNNTDAKHSYRAEIDGLRAIAVIAVLIFHAFPHALPGGFLGVDIFFVISGYLITGIISSDIDRGEFSIVTFYQRRIRRIYPALIAVLIATLIAGFIILPPTQMHQLGWHVMGASFFIPNLVLWSETGYFDVRSLTKPLLHLWSLGVEEQFYIVWPLVLLLVKRLRLNIVMSLAAIVIASLAYNIHLEFAAPTAAFYSPLSRAWELGLGGLIACRQHANLAARYRTLFATVGALLIFCALAFATDAKFSSSYAAAAVAGAGLVISSGPGNVVALALSRRPLVAVGLISYPLYLWHWPILVLARNGQDYLPVSTTLKLIAAAVVLGVCTYWFVERPVRRLRLRKASLTLLAALLVLGAFGAVTSRLDIRSLSYPAKMREILAYSHYDFRSNARVGTCWLYKPDQRYLPECDFKQGDLHPRVAVWGDSHAGRLFPGLALAAAGKASVATFAADSCPPIRNFEACSPFTEDALGAIIRNKPNIAVLFARWSFYSKTYGDGPAREGLNSYIDALEQAGIKVAIIGPFPEYPGQLPDVVYERWVADKSKGIPNRIPDMPIAWARIVDDDLRALAGKRNLPYLSLLDLFCQNDVCATSWSDDPSDLLSWDYGHLTTDAGRFIGGKLLEDPIFLPEP